MKKIIVPVTLATLFSISLLSACNFYTPESNPVPTADPFIPPVVSDRPFDTTPRVTPVPGVGNTPNADVIPMVPATVAPGVNTMPGVVDENIPGVIDRGTVTPKVTNPPANVNPNSIPGANSPYQTTRPGSRISPTPRALTTPTPAVTPRNNTLPSPNAGYGSNVTPRPGLTNTSTPAPVIPVPRANGNNTGMPGTTPGNATTTAPLPPAATIPPMTGQTSGR